jgi:hypothetical protein
MDIRIEGRDLPGRDCAAAPGFPGYRNIHVGVQRKDRDLGVFTMFRRAKLMFDAVDPEVLRAAGRSGRLVARLGLRDGRGQPLCAAVRPPGVQWSAG